MDGNYRIYKLKIEENDLLIGGFFEYDGTVMNIKSFDVTGNMTNQLGISGIKDVMNEFGKFHGVTQINIIGNNRTTGANPGKIQHVTFNIY